MVPRLLHSIGFRSAQLHAAGLGAVALCLTLWTQAKTMDQKERENAERRAIFVGLWPPTLWLIGNALQQVES